FAAVKSGWQAFLARSNDKMPAFLALQDLPAVAFADKEIRPVYKKMVESQLKDLSEWNAKDGEKSGVAAMATGAQAGKTIIAACIAAVCIGFISAVLFAVSLKRRINRLNKSINALQTECLASLENGITAMAIGDLTYEVNVHGEPINDKSGDELG